MHSFFRKKTEVLNQIKVLLKYSETSENLIFETSVCTETLFVGKNKTYFRFPTEIRFLFFRIKAEVEKQQYTKKFFSI